MYFVIQKKHNTSGWDNGVIAKDSYDDAMHQFHAFMSTYGYGQYSMLDYVACTIETDDGRVLKNEIDDRREG